MGHEVASSGHPHTEIVGLANGGLCILEGLDMGLAVR
eukprot:CAMPEP_0175968904 /NCGR_PEP_ID=MMETSP0108-20121206/40166_1 /TAXON_ID=195067 ORGANISM="Goniomonas pacifica, Strain CCMP1869" /NCGR_SAMPLE_ID=MMETSP0108 /ASSEMBLY_ACC=CAM_ASM_000204 /LENGTH=36 /DNA_ID= /DNA_START= /DNA_END= /DNA_ORIENTATION=